MTEQETVTAEERMKRLAAHVEKFDKDKANASEFKEFKEKIVKDVEEVQKALRANVTRASDHGGYAGGPHIGQKLVEAGMTKGVKALGRNPEADGIGMAVRRYRDDPVSGVPTTTPFWDEEVNKALEVMDQVYVADELATKLWGTRWAQEKVNKGEREAFTSRFPDLGTRYHKIWRFLQEAQGKAGVDDLSTTDSGDGSEWIPTGYSSNLLDDVRLAFPETAIFRRFNQPTKSFVYPILNGIGQAYIRTENTDVTQGTLTTANRTWTAVTIANLQEFSEEIRQDSIVDIAATVRANAVRSLGEALAEAIVSGDDSTTHQDDDINGTAGHPAKAWDGLRHYAFVGTDVATNGGGDALTVADIMDLRGQMGKYAAGAEGGRLVFLCAPSAWIDLLSDSDLKDHSSRGETASLITGAVGNVYGVPVLLSHGVADREDATAAGGFNVSSSNSVSVAVMVHRDAWLIGDRQMSMIETDKVITSGKHQLVNSARWSFNAVFRPTTNATEFPHTGVIRNID